MLKLASQTKTVAPHVRLLFSFAVTAAMCAGAHAEETTPEGVKGWWYYIAPNTSGYVGTAAEACARSAANHWGTPLLSMRPSDLPKPIFECFYKNPIGGRVFDYTHTQLVCDIGYTPKAPGVCVKWAEPSRPVSGGPDQPGYTCANPVAVSSGAKVQSETDLPGLPNGALRITRTYRTLRESGAGQSAGQTWSFSFDRHFAFTRALNEKPGAPPSKITGAFGDGAYVEFSRQDSGTYVSIYDRRETLESLSPALDDWRLTTRDGSIERFTKRNGVFLLVSTHTREGVAQFYTYNSANKLVMIADAIGRTVIVSWEGDTVASIASATGSVRYRYATLPYQDDAALPGTDLLTSVDFYDEAEQRIATRRYHYEDPNFRYLLTGVTDENGARFATYAYNQTGQVVLSEHAGGADRYTFAYPEKTKRIITDPLGTERQINLSYDADSSGRVAGSSQPAGAGCAAGTSTLTYDSLGSTSSSIDFNGNKTCFINEPVRGLMTSRVAGLAADAACPASATASIAPGSRRVSARWHPDFLLETAVASPRKITRYVYNGQPGTDGKVASCADNATLPNGKAIAVLCAVTVQATRDSNGGQGFAAQPDGPPRTWHYHYNASGQLLKRAGPPDSLGQVNSISLSYYDDTTASHAKGDLARLQNATGEVTLFLEYTKDGLASKIKRADGVIIKREYGPRQRLVSSSIEDGEGGTLTTRYTHDSAGQLTQITAPDGATFTFNYDDAHRLTSLRDDAGNQVQLVLDNKGNVLHQELRNATGGLALESNRAFDALSRLASEQRDLLSPPTTFQYDRNGNLTAMKDALGRVSTSGFDNFDRIVETILPPAAPGKPGGTIGYGFDHQDQLISVTDPRALTTLYMLDGYGQRTALSSPDTGTENATFDAAGNLIASRDARGITTAYRYDASQRITKTGDITFEYGKAGSSAAGQLTAMMDESGKSTFTYDGYGRAQTKTQIVGIGTAVKQFNLAYQYGTSGGSAGHVNSITYPSGNRIAITYAAGGRAVSLTVMANGAPPKTILSNIGYTPFGAIQSWTWGNSTSVNPPVYKREFDTAGRITSYPLGQIGSNGNIRTLNYDASDRIKSFVHRGEPNAIRLDQNFTYDDLDRLTRVEGTTISQAFEYDANGNRIRVRFGASVDTNAISPTSNRLTRTSGPAPAKNNTFDNAGNLTRDGYTNYTYGKNGRVMAVDRAGVATSYQYNGFGQRVEKAGVGGNLTYYVYDLAGRLLGEYDRDGNASQETVYLGDLPVAVLKRRVGLAPGQAVITDVYNVYADHILTPRVITRSSDNRMVWRWDNADPFGMQQPEESPGGLTGFPYNPRFPGQVYDKETNNHYNYFRDYDPETGRYVESDPIGLRGGINTYGYVGGNPVSKIDPLGLEQCDIDAARITAKRYLPNLNVGGGPPKADYTGDGWWGEAQIIGRKAHYDGHIHMTTKFLKPLDLPMQARVLENYYHEAGHFTWPDAGHDTIYPYARANLERSWKDFKALRDKLCECKK